MNWKNLKWGSMRDSLSNHGGREKPNRTTRAYRNFFQGYTTQMTPKGKLRYVYTAEYYTQQLTDQQRRGVKALYALLFVLTTAIFIWMATLPWGFNTVLYVGIFQATSVFALGWLLLSLLYYIFAPKLLTIYLWRTMIGFHFRCASIAAVGSFALLLAASLVWVVLHIGTLRVVELICLPAYALCGAMLYLIFRVEKRISYIPVDASGRAIDL